MTGEFPSEVSNATIAVAAADVALPRRRRGRPRFGGNVELVVGTTITVLLAALVILAPVLAHDSPTAQDLLHPLAGPSSTHLLGTDNLGRDIWSRLLYGGRVDLGLAAVAVLIPFVGGTMIGAICGYVGGWLDVLVMRIADIAAAFPFYVLVIALVFVLGSGASSILVAISIISWVAYARIVRAEVLVLRRREFIESARTGGLNSRRIVLRHVLPNTITQAIVYAMSDIVQNIGVIVTLSYFGLGIVPPTADWGQMISGGQQFLGAGKYSLVLIPGAAVVITSLGLAFLGDGLANVLRAKR